MTLKQALRGASLVLALLTLAAHPLAFAAAGDYEFRLVESSIRQGEAVLAVRLVDKRSGAAVPNAVIFATRLDMEPDGMETMTTPVEALPSTEPGIYRYRTTLTMEGGWRFSLAAKVQGEAGTVEARLVLKVVP